MSAGIIKPHWFEAWVLRRALRVFEDHGWRDVPGRTPVVADTRAQLAYRAKVLRSGS